MRPHPPFRVLVVNAFHRQNRGDAVLLSVMLSQVEQAHPGAEIEVAGFEQPEEFPTFDGARNLGSVRRWVGEEDIPRLRRISRKLVLLLLSLASFGGRPVLRAAARILPTEPARELRALLDADLVVSLSGGLFNGKPSLASDLNIAFLLWPIWLASRISTPVVLGPQSFGPFPRPSQRWMMRGVLDRVSAILVREDISIDQLRAVGLSNPRVARAVDGAFSYRSRENQARTQLQLPPEARIVCVTAREWLAPAAQHRFEQAMAGLTRHLLDRGYHVVFVPQVTCAFQADDDRLVHARITEGIDHPGLRVLNDERLDHDSVRAIYSDAELVVGTRFHSVIFSLSAYVPCVAIQYDHKTRGIMTDLGLEQWVIDMEKVDERAITTLVDDLAEQQESYRARLREVIPGYVDRSDATVRWLRHPERPLAAADSADPQPAAMAER